MYNSDTELLFPSRVVPVLRSLRGKEWEALVERVNLSDPDSPDQLAFVLMMVRLSGCISCNADSFRAMRGCTQCARQSIRRYRGDDEELLDEYKKAYQEIVAYLDKNAVQNMEL